MRRSTIGEHVAARADGRNAADRRDALLVGDRAELAMQHDLGTGEWLTFREHARDQRDAASHAWLELLLGGDVDLGRVAVPRARRERMQTAVLESVEGKLAVGIGLRGALPRSHVNAGEWLSVLAQHSPTHTERHAGELSARALRQAGVPRRGRCRSRASRASSPPRSPTARGESSIHDPSSASPLERARARDQGLQ